MVDCYLAQSRHREAVSVATSSCKQLNNSPRALTLYANVLYKDPLQLSATKAKSLLEKALVANQHYLPAVYLLAEILEQEMNLDQVCYLRSHGWPNFFCQIQWGSEIGTCLDFE